MDSISFQKQSLLEDKLNVLQQMLHTEEATVAEKINQFTGSEKNTSAKQALLVHITLNISLITTLFYLLA